MLGDADDGLDAGGLGFEDRVSRERGRHVDHRGIGACFFYGIGAGIEYRALQMGLAPAARRDTTDDVGAVGDALFGVEGALAAGKALDDEFGVIIDENAHDRS